MSYAVREKSLTRSYLRSNGLCQVIGRGRYPIVYFDKFEAAEKARVEMLGSWAAVPERREVVHVQWVLRWHYTDGSMLPEECRYRPPCGGGATREESDRHETKEAARASAEDWVFDRSEGSRCRIVRVVRRVRGPS